MSRLATALLLVLGLIAIIPTSHALLVDCDLSLISMFRSYTSPPAPVVQINGAPPQFLGFPPGFSPFFSRSNAAVNIPATDNVNSLTPTNFVSVTNVNNPIGIFNNRIYINLTIGTGSDPGFLPNVTFTWNGQRVPNCFTANTATPVNTQLSGGSCTAANGDSIALLAGGVVLLGLTPVLQCTNNTLWINASGNSYTTGSATCGRLYVFNISNPTTCNSTIVGDPQFLGLRGQSFQVHGIDGAVYNLISDKTMQMNSRFSFLNGPRACPIMPTTGKKSPSCWSHPGSYLGEVGIATSGGDRLFIRAGAASIGFAAITLNDEHLTLGASQQLTYANGTEASEVRLLSSHEVSVVVGSFIVEIENIDSFLNLRSVSVTGSIGKLQSHGLLGQTWQNKRYPSTLKVIEGEVDDYVITDDDIFGTDFIYNQFATSQE